MTTPKRRQELYSMMLQFMRLHKLNTVPLDLSSVCRAADTDLVPLSKIIEETGLTESEVFQIWGNEDGTVNAIKADTALPIMTKCLLGVSGLRSARNFPT